MRIALWVVLVVVSLFACPAWAAHELYAGWLNSYTINGAHFSGESGTGYAMWLSKPRGGKFRDGNLYFADTGNDRIRRISDKNERGENNRLKSSLLTVAGSGDPYQYQSTGYSGDGGVATSAKLNRPTALTFDKNGNMYIGDSGNHRIRRVAPFTNIITTFAGNGQDNHPEYEEWDVLQGYGYPALESPIVGDIMDLHWQDGELFIATGSGVFYIAEDGYMYRIAKDVIMATSFAEDEEKRLYVTANNGILYRMFPDKTLKRVYLNSSIDGSNPSVALHHIDFDRFGALFAAGGNSYMQGNNVFKVFDGNRMRNTYGRDSTYENDYAVHPEDIIVDRERNRYFVINTEHEWIAMVSNFDEGGMDPVDGNNDIDGSCGLDATTDGEMFSCNPVNLATGTKVDYVQDLAHNGPFPINWGRYYHSKKGGWTFEYERSISFRGYGPGATLLMNRPDGVILSFKRGSNNTWLRDMGSNKSVINFPKEVFSGLQIIGYEYKNLRDEIERYDAKGNLQYIQSKEGWRITTERDGFGKLIKVKDSFGHEFLVTHSTPNDLGETTIASVSDGERTVEYTYKKVKHRWLLERVKDASGVYTKYGYRNPFGLANHNFESDGEERGLLTSIRKEVFINGGYYTSQFGVADYVYDRKGRAIQTVHNSLTSPANKNEFVYYDEFGETDFIQSGVTNYVQWSKEAYTNGASKPRQISGPCITCTGSKFKRSEFDEFGNPIIQYNFINVQTKNVYDTVRGLPLESVEAVGTPKQTKTTFQWDPDVRLPKKVVKQKMINDQLVNITTQNAYNSDGQLTQSVLSSSTGEQSRIQTIEYNSMKLPEKIFDAMGRVTEYTYNSSGYITSIKNNVGHIVNFSDYTISGIPRLITYPNGLQHRIVLNGFHKIATFEEGSPDAGWRKTVFEYDEIGNLLEKKFPAAESARYYYFFGLLKSFSRASGTNEYTYDEHTRVIKEKSYPAYSSQTVEKNYGYDEYGRLSSVSALNDFFSYQYDKEGNLISSYANGLNKHYEYDEFNQLVEERFEDAFVGGTMPTSVTKREYYSNGLLKAGIDERGVRTTYLYNGFGELSQIQSPDSGIQTILRNKNGEAIESIDGRGVKTVITRDGIGRIISKNILLGNASASEGFYLGDQNQTFVYDTCQNGMGMLCSAINYSGAVSYTYNVWQDTTNKLFVPSGTSLAFSTNYEYASNGKLEFVYYPSTRRLYYSTVPSRLKPWVVTFDWQLIIDNSFFNPLTGDLLKYEGPVIKYDVTHDQGGNVSQLKTVSNKKIFNTSFGGMFTSIFSEYGPDSPNPKHMWYVHDPKGYVASANLMNQQEIIYDYDLAGNRTIKSVDETAEGTMFYNYSPISNRLESIVQSGVPTANFMYDNSGNTISGKNWSYKYDGENRMREAFNGSLVKFEYNALGQRVKKVGFDGVEYYVYDEQGRMIGVYGSDGQPKEEVVWLDDWRPVATMRGSGALSKLYHIETDQLQTPTAVRDNTGKLVWSWDSREPFGYQAPIKIQPAMANFSH